MIARPLLFASLQPELAEAKGVNLRLFAVLFLAIVALATAECAQIVGVLLVFTLMVGPAAAAQRLTSRVGGGLALSAALALAEAWGGIALALLDRLAQQLLDHRAERDGVSGRRRGALSGPEPDEFAGVIAGTSVACGALEGHYEPGDTGRSITNQVLAAHVSPPDRGLHVP